MLLGQPGKFTISALEKSVVMEYDFAAFKRLVSQHTDIAGFYISYMEQHWIIEKEPEEISLRHDSAATRYKNFVDRYPDLQGRLKQHHIASYLGITPEGLSRIKKDIAKKVFNTSNP
jgi:CRP-like cAMP-binding protein